ncbi:phage holin family protein [Hansschlegelia sp. KR7-227]|uniref:phage holin family protein n=1 Tax=Hansschlegelia sp. KR7-227 TaxID=3400914 RepID=UPI003BFB8B03
MLRLLLQAGLGFATFDIGRRIARLKRQALFLSIAALLGLLGLGALTAAAVAALEPRFGLPVAALMVGGGLIVVAGIVAWVGSWERRPVARGPAVVDRVRAEVAAAGSALSSTRRSRPVHDTAPLPVRPPGARRKRALNMTLIAVLAGIVLGRRL